jgi:hypothetical protein
MKKKMISKKLIFSKQTVTNLNEKVLNLIFGGVSGKPVCTDQTYCFDCDTIITTPKIACCSCGTQP